MTAAALELRGIRCVFKQASAELVMLNGIDLLLRSVGPSEAGKLTMLHIAGRLERPDGGAVMSAARIAGASARSGGLCRAVPKSALSISTIICRPNFSALENVMPPQMIAVAPRRQARKRAAGLLDQVG